MTAPESDAYPSGSTLNRLSAQPCFAFVVGDKPVDRTPGEHVWQQQPFYNHDARRWCSRCGWLVAA